MNVKQQRITLSKKTMRKVLFAMLLTLTLGLTASAQSRREVMRNRVDSVLRANYEKGVYDTLYMKRPDSKLTLRLRGNLSGTSIEGKDKDDGGPIKSDLKTKPRGTISVGASYLGLSAAVAINPASLAGKSRDTEYNINFYGNRFGLEANFLDSKTLSGDISQAGNSIQVEKGDARFTLFTITGYYAFNHRRFSYPAAFTQSYIQKRSAGSWLLGATFQSGRIKDTDDAPAYMNDTRLTMNCFAIGGGYGHNFVAKKWLFHISAQPCLIVYNDNSVRVNGEKQKTGTHFPEMIFNTRAAIIYNINRKYFAGSTFLFNTTVLGDKDEYTDLLKWRARAFVGIRL